ncbi:glycosyltransferase [Bizionia saleffrena]|uniref:Glycosyltransferase n=1 Tax=Bizionia saleffrena TaxID=291189 RepID=A0A8H2LH67_9FLAO|nr:TIGR04283 family arsenosugar biosynthesis glycosyltransferase [Bizionia saleffrena]TYB78132.1 glycosyltransferase [Bizionia saleffrena]
MITIIVPILNEAETIERLISHLLVMASPSSISEIIIVDGGSTDGSQGCVKGIKNEKLILIHSEKGRAKQMNAGAKLATGKVLYFLHADSYPPANYDALILNEINKNNLAGCFKMKFDNSHWWLHLASYLTHFSWRACRGGDQSQFITTALFFELEGFNEDFIIYEDNDLINKLYARKQFVVIQEWLTTSARRYEKNGIWKLQYYFWAIYVKKWRGASADELYQYYKKNIA